MSYHSTVHTNPELRRMLKEAFTPGERAALVMKRIKGKPARSRRGVYQYSRDSIEVYGSDFVAYFAMGIQA